MPCLRNLKLLNGPALRQAIPTVQGKNGHGVVLDKGVPDRIKARCGSWNSFTCCAATNIAQTISERAGTTHRPNRRLVDGSCRECVPQSAGRRPLAQAPGADPYTTWLAPASAGPGQTRP